MGLRDVHRRLTASTEDLHRESLRGAWSDHGAQPIREVVPRQRVRVGGEVHAVQVAPRAGAPSLEVSVHDGTGRVVARFTGRRAIGGITPGRRLLLEGLAADERGHLVMINPSYTLLPS